MARNWRRGSRGGSSFELPASEGPRWPTLANCSPGLGAAWRINRGLVVGRGIGKLLAFKELRESASGLTAGINRQNGPIPEWRINRWELAEGIRGAGVSDEGGMANYWGSEWVSG